MAQAVPPEENYLGKPYSDWAAEWWVWICGISPRDHPTRVRDTAQETDTGDGPVRFLAGTFGEFEEGVHRKCTIPAGKAIFVPVVTVISSVAEGDDARGRGPTTESRLLNVARSNMDKVTSIQVKVDGVEIPDIWNYRIESRAFELNLGAQNILRDDHHPNVRSGPSQAVTDGYYVLLKPLPPGKHEIYIQARGIPPEHPDKPYKSEVTYIVEVTAAKTNESETSLSQTTEQA